MCSVELRSEVQKKVEKFVVDYYQLMSRQLFNGFGVLIPAAPEVSFLETPIAQDLMVVGEAAEGLLHRDAETEEFVSDTCQMVCQGLFAGPRADGFYKVPAYFWSTPIGDLIYRGLSWAEGEDDPEPYRDTSEV